MSCSFTRIVAVVTLLAAAVTLVDGDKRVCTYHSGVAINASDISPPTATSSVDLCCGLCKGNATCLAAQYNTQTRFCHLKGELGPLVIQANAVIVTLDQPTPPPVPTPTQSPLPPIFNAALFTECDDDSSCPLIKGDDLCSTTMLPCGMCSWLDNNDARLVTCATDLISVEYFNSNNCSGPVAFSHLYDNLGTCYSSSGEYKKQFLAMNVTAFPGAAINFYDCPLGCDTCDSIITYSSGQCYNNDDGSSTIATCTKDYIFTQSFLNSATCTGPTLTFVYPNGVCYGESNKYSC